MAETREMDTGAKDKRNDLDSYVWMWVRFLLVTAGALWAYYELVGVATSLVPELSWLGKGKSYLTETYIGSALIVIGGTLFWWRAIKVFVFLGSPLPFGITVTHGWQDSGTKGRIAHMLHIGDMDVYDKNPYAGKFWYGAVYRAHPGSDKLMRARLEFLALGFWGNRTILVFEGRFLFAKKTHEERARMYRLSFDRYSKSPDQFQKKVSDSLSVLNESLQSVKAYIAERRVIEAVEAERAGENDSAETVHGKLSQEEKDLLFSLGQKLEPNPLKGLGTQLPSTTSPVSAPANQPDSPDKKSVEYFGEAGDALLIKLRRYGLISRLEGHIQFFGSEGSGYCQIELSEKGVEVYELEKQRRTPTIGQLLKNSSTPED